MLFSQIRPFSNFSAFLPLFVTKYILHIDQSKVDTHVQLQLPEMDRGDFDDCKDN